jgi:hypothetical protein
VKGLSLVDSWETLIRHSSWIRVSPLQSLSSPLNSLRLDGIPLMCPLCLGSPVHVSPRTGLPPSSPASRNVSSRLCLEFALCSLWALTCPASHDVADEHSHDDHVPGALALGFARIPLCQDMPYGTIRAEADPCHLLPLVEWHSPDGVYDRATSSIFIAT